MPQYDPYEDPKPIIPPPKPVADHTSPRSPFSKVPVNKALTTCYGEGINKTSDTDTPEIDENSPPPSPKTFRRRHSHLSYQESPLENPLESVNFPELSTSHRTLSPAERSQLAEFEREQQQDDKIRMDLESNQQHPKKTVNKHREEEPIELDLETEFKKEKHMLNGGWMHRSRASCELLRDHKYPNVGGD